MLAAEDLADGEAVVEEVEVDMVEGTVSRKVPLNESRRWARACMQSKANCSAAAPMSSMSHTSTLQSSEHDSS